MNQQFMVVLGAPGSGKTSLLGYVAEQLIRFLTRLCRGTDRKVFVILDNLNLRTLEEIGADILPIDADAEGLLDGLLTRGTGS